MIERKYLAHFIDANFGESAVENYRLGKDIEEYNIEMNPDTETVKNILGESSTHVKGYEPQASVETFYADYDDVLSNKLWDLINSRATGDKLKTTVVDVILKEDMTVVSAYREDAIIVINSAGGDTGGVNIAFDIKYNGNRVSGSWNVETKTFTPAGSVSTQNQTE